MRICFTPFCILKYKRLWFTFHTYEFTCFKHFTHVLMSCIKFYNDFAIDSFAFSILNIIRKWSFFYICKAHETVHQNTCGQMYTQHEQIQYHEFSELAAQFSWNCHFPHNIYKVTKWWICAWPINLLIYNFREIYIWSSLIVIFGKECQCLWGNS